MPEVEFAVIAGDLGPRIVFDGPNDGVVLVEDTRLTGMKEWRVLHHTHTLIMMAKDTAELCSRFLESGSFDAGDWTS